MIQAHVVTHLNRDQYVREWDSFLKLRHEYFVDERGWREPSPDGREVDQFDTDDATYILGVEDGEVVGSARIIPTNLPNLVSDVFPQFCNVRPVPDRPDWADWTRSFIAKRKRSYGLRGTAGQMACAVMEYCLEEGIKYAGGIQLLYFLPRWNDIGWNAEPMGTPQKIDGDWCIVAYMEVSEEALHTARAHCGVEGPLLVRRGHQRPFIRDPRERRLPDEPARIRMVS